MSLESVELLIEFEKYFGVQIANSDAEKMICIQDSVKIISRYIGISSQDHILRTDIFNKISQLLAPSTTIPKLTDKVVDYLPNDTLIGKIEQLSVALGLKIPLPSASARHDTRSIWLFRSVWRPTYRWVDLTFAEFTDVICIQNYRELLNSKSLQSQYEAYIAIGGVCVEKLGIDAYDISPEKSFTDDLGID